MFHVTFGKSINSFHRVCFTVFSATSSTKNNEVGENDRKEKIAKCRGWSIVFLRLSASGWDKKKKGREEAKAARYIIIWAVRVCQRKCLIDKYTSKIITTTSPYGIAAWTTCNVCCRETEVNCNIIMKIGDV